jgi:transposase-like protein
MRVWAMKPIFHACQRFPADVIRHAAWLYLRFTWNVRDIEDLPSDCKLKVSNELPVDSEFLATHFQKLA